MDAKLKEPIKIVLQDRSWTCGSLVEATRIIRELDDELRCRIGDRKAKQVAERDARIRLGTALNIVRLHVGHGGWAPFVASVVNNRKTAWACMRLAKSVGTADGEIDVDEVESRRASLLARLPAGRRGQAAKHPLVAKAVAFLSTRELEQLSGAKPLPEELQMSLMEDKNGGKCSGPASSGEAQEEFGMKGWGVDGDAEYGKDGENVDTVTGSGFGDNPERGEVGFVERRTDQVKLAASRGEGGVYVPPRRGERPAPITGDQLSLASLYEEQIEPHFAALLEALEGAPRGVSTELLVRYRELRDDTKRALMKGGA